jgi:hypothetical protein
MSPTREAFVLPALFLTVVLLGGLRFGEKISLVPPPVFTLVLGVLLIQVVVQSGALAPERLLSASRSALANANGFMVMATLWLASSQTVALLIPDSGLPRIACSVFFFILLLNTAAAAPDRVRLLRSLGVTFGAAFILKFVVLYELSAPGTRRLQRVLQAILDNVTLGVLVQEAQRPVTGYVALLAVALFLLGVFCLPARRDERLARVERPRLPHLTSRMR